MLPELQTIQNWQLAISSEIPTLKTLKNIYTVYDKSTHQLSQWHSTLQWHSQNIIQGRKSTTVNDYFWSTSFNLYKGKTEFVSTLLMKTHFKPLQPINYIFTSA
jgi:hypothetical protein